MSLHTSNKFPTELHPKRGVKPVKVNPYLGAAYREIERKHGLSPLGKRGKRLAAGDRATSEKVREIGFCEARGVRVPCAGSLQDAHVMRRGHMATRHLPENQTCLCEAHHRYFTDRPRTWQAFIRATKPGLWRRLWVLSHHAAEIGVGGASRG